MSKIFTEDATGKKWRVSVEDCDKSGRGWHYIEPLPEPKRTKEQILRELDYEISRIVAGEMEIGAILKGHRLIARATALAAAELAELARAEREGK